MGEWSNAWVRTAIHGFMEARGLNVLDWTKRAGVAESTLRNFLNGGTEAAITIKTLDLLANAEGVTVAVLLGQAPDLTANQLRAAEIAGKLNPDDLAAWLHWGARTVPPPVSDEQLSPVAARKPR